MVSPKPLKDMKTPPIPHEAQVLARTAQGNAQAFTTLYQHYHPKVYHTALKMLKSPELAEGTVQEVFLKLWQGRKKLAEVRDFQDYLFIITRNHIYNRFRRMALEQKVRETYSQNRPTSTTGTEDAVADREYAALLQEALAQLPPQQKQVYHLAREEGLSHQEIADRLNLSRLTVKKHMAIALKRIRELVMNNE